MKKIGIDARLYSQTGVGVYIRNLLYYLDNIYQGRDNFYIYLKESDYHQVKFSQKNFIKRKTNFSWHTVGEQTGYLSQLNDDHLDLMHFTYFSYPIFYQRKFLATIHDLTPLYFKTGKASTKNRLIYETKYLIFKKVLKTQVNKAEAIIVPTLAVKKQLTDYFGLLIGKKVTTVYEGINHELFLSKENLQLKNKFRDKFFIYVGNFYPHKNLEKLIAAFSRIKNQDYKLVLIGPQDFFYNRLVQFIIKLKQDHRINIYVNQSINDLVFFYKKAVGLIHPSLSEGFGLPLLEASYYDLPIIASEIPVFKEILGKEAVFFDPRSIDDIRDKIDGFIDSKPKFNKKKILHGRTFENMAKKTLDIYKDLIYH